MSFDIVIVIQIGKVIHMKKKLLFLLGTLLVIIFTSVLATSFVNRKDDEEEKFTVVTSFYPMYVLAKNIIGDIDDINLVNLTEYISGCLHDYQLTTADMKRLEGADGFVMNGGGMENFIEDILKLYENLPIIDSSTGIPMLESAHTHEHSHDDEASHSDKHADHAHEEDHDHEHADHAHEEDHAHGQEEDHDGHDHGEFNSHIWLNVDYHRIQLENVLEGLISLQPEHEDELRANAAIYDEKLVELSNQFKSELAHVKGEEVVIFHDAFDYLAVQLGMDVVYTIHMDNETSLSAGEIGEVIDEVNHHDIKVLFTEEQYSTNIPANIANETDAKVYIVDSVVTGEFEADGYLKAMNYNLDLLKDIYGVK